VARLFGTDGVRGIANADLTPELALRVGRAAAAVLAEEQPADRPIVIGRDTRLSGSLLEAAIVAGVTSVGRDVLTIGIAPTPAVAAVARHRRAAAGIVISASHNPIEDNGIKIFGGDGYKLTDTVEARIEAALDRDDLPRPTHAGVGAATAEPELVDRYVADLVKKGADLSSLVVVVDAAFGAAYRVAPEALRRLDAHVVALHAEPDGSRINVACGTTDMRALTARVREVAAASPNAHVVGVAFDGDADRALFVDEDAHTVSGDHVMLALARERKARGALPGDTLVGTVMSNVGLERALAASNIGLLRTPVGDRYVLEAMRAGGFVLGGEQSGHIIDVECNTTGDGPMTCVQLLSLVARERTTLRDLVRDMRVYPQILLNVRTLAKDEVEQDREVRSAIARAERELGEEGRVLVRSSGTEPLVRVMVEGRDRASTERIARDIVVAVEAAALRDSPASPA
jgi:phosphoglucosamine mutase